jgi:hypothetical protein
MLLGPLPVPRQGSPLTWPPKTTSPRSLRLGSHASSNVLLLLGAGSPGAATLVARFFWSNLYTPRPSPKHDASGSVQLPFSVSMIPTVAISLRLLMSVWNRLPRKVVPPGAGWPGSSTGVTAPLARV